MNTNSDTFAVLCTVQKQALPSVGMANDGGYQTRKHSCSLRASVRPHPHHPGAGTPRSHSAPTPPVPVRNDGARERGPGMKLRCSSSYSLLDAVLPIDGEVLCRWRVITRDY